MEYCGIDAHSKSSTVCIVNLMGKRLLMEKTPSTRDGLEEKMGTWDVGMPIVVEACSASRPVIRYLTEIGFENITVVNPAATARMRARGKKTDIVDAQGLAELARLGLTEGWKVHIPGEWAQKMRDTLYEREFVIKQRVAIANRVKALFRREGKTAPALKGSSGWKKMSKILPEYERQLEFWRSMRDQYVAKELELTRSVKEKLKSHPGYDFIRTVPCVGPLTAAVLLACIDDVSRFESSRAMAGYFGIVPNVFQSGTTERTGAITKRGSRLARKILCQAAHHAQYSSNAFNPVWREIAKNKGKSKATMAVAHKIVRASYAVLKYNQPFDPAKMGILKVDEEVKIIRAFKKTHKSSR